ncbi:MAG: TrbC/VirB2 family protein [Campylobacter sp.]|nr:TrbC/VirB2 family protein [Campylobacter sp.]
MTNLTQQISRKLPSLKRLSAAFTLFTFLPNFASAAGGLDKVNSFLDNLSSWLTAGGAVIATIAIIIAGYKIMYGGKTVGEVAPIIIGGVLIGSASAITSFFIGS